MEASSPPTPSNKTCAYEPTDEVLMTSCQFFLVRDASRRRLSTSRAPELREACAAQGPPEASNSIARMVCSFQFRLGRSCGPARGGLSGR